MPQISLILIGYVSSGGRSIFELAVALITLGPLIYGGIYIINDIFDYKLDGKNIEKLKRPIASNQLSLKQAKFIAFPLICVGFFSAFFLSKNFFLLSLLILTNNFMYSVYPRIKDIIYLDIISNSLNYVLRYLAGAILIGLSSKILFCSMIIFLIAFLNFLCFRLREYKTSGKNSKIIFERINIHRIKYYFSLTQVLYIITLIYSYYKFSPTFEWIILFLIVSNIFLIGKFILANEGIAFDHMVNPLWTMRQNPIYIFFSFLYYIEFLLLLFLFSSYKDINIYSLIN